MILCMEFTLHNHEIYSNLFAYDFPKGQRGEMHSYEDRLKNFESKIEEMRRYIQEAKQQTVDAEQKIRNSRIYG